MRQDGVFHGPDGEFHYIDWGGRGPLAHFAHATGFCAGAYTPLAERLGSHLRVMGMDDRGHGKSHVPADPTALKNWDIFAEDLERFFLSLRDPVIAMGHSRGAVASLMVAVKRPQRVRALILIDPTILPFHWKWPWFLAKQAGLSRFIPIAARAAKRKRVWPDRDTILRAYRDKSLFRGWKDGFLEGYIADGTTENGDGTVTLCCKPNWESRCFAVCPHDVWPHVSKLRVPILVIYGAQSDTFLPPAVRRFKAMVPHAACRCFEKTGHFVPMERPDETAEAILTFLRDQKLL